MNRQDFLKQLADILIADPGALAPQARLASFRGWDSMGKMAALTLLDADMNIPVPLDWLQKCETVGDLLEFVGPHLKD